MPKVAVIVPVYRETLLSDEEYAVRHLRRHLCSYDCYQISPQSLIFQIDGLKARKYENQRFTRVDTYSQLLLFKWFYEGFASYDYVLIYQLDCLVFRDELQQWCEQGFDCIGAPLPVSKQVRIPSQDISRVGNCGLSLRRIRRSSTCWMPGNPRCRASSGLATEATGLCVQDFWPALKDDTDHELIADIVKRCMAPAETPSQQSEELSRRLWDFAASHHSREAFRRSMGIVPDELGI